MKIELIIRFSEGIVKYSCVAMFVVVVKISNVSKENRLATVVVSIMYCVTVLRGKGLVKLLARRTC